MADRTLRFLGITAAFQAVIAPLSYRIWEDYLRHGAEHRHDLPLWLWPVVLAYIGVPAVLGTVLGYHFNRGKKWAQVIVGPTAPPTAWDALFSGDPTDLFVLMKLKSGGWLGGQYVEGSYVGGYPEPADIYLRRELMVDQEEGDFVRRTGPNDEFVETGSFGVLVRWAEVEYLEVSD